MRDIRIGAAQFEHRDGDKAYNLSRIEALARKAVEQGAEIVSFHECSIPGYTWLQTLDSAGLALVSESVPDGPSTRALVSIAKRHRIIVMAGLIEAAPDGRSYNSYVTVGPDGFITRFHKLHPFIHPDLAPGGGYQVIELAGCKVGFLICYDLNLPENARITALMGAEIIFMPHVTGCLASPMPGRGTVDKALWDNRERDPVRLRMELEGPKNRGWLMRFLLGERRLRHLQQPDRCGPRHDQRRQRDDHRSLRRGRGREPHPGRRRRRGPACPRETGTGLRQTLLARAQARALRQARRAGRRAARDASGVDAVVRQDVGPPTAWSSSRSSPACGSG
jgi:hypothetical protein